MLFSIHKSKIKKFDYIITIQNIISNANNKTIIYLLMCRQYKFLLLVRMNNQNNFILNGNIYNERYRTFA